MVFSLEKMNLIGLDFICFFDIKAGKRYIFHEKIAGKTPNFQEKSWKTVLKNSGNPGIDAVNFRVSPLLHPQNWPQS